MDSNARSEIKGFAWRILKPGRAEADAPTWVCKIPPSPIEKLIPNPSVFALTAGTLALQNSMSLIPKTKQALRVGDDEP